MRVAVVGIGAIAPLHIRGIMGAGQEIVALCDIEKEKCVKANEEFGLYASVYSDFNEMIECETLDVVHICTPHYLHAPMTCACLDKGINVLSEKPVAINQKQLWEIELAVKNSKAQLGVCFQTRYNETTQYIKEFFKDKTITSAYANLTWCRDKDYYASGAWRGTWAQEGGGVMINQEIHSLDNLQWICGKPISVLAHVSNNSLKDTIEVEDTAFAIFGLENGGNFVPHATNASKFSFPVYLAFRSENDPVELSAENLIINGKCITKSNGQPIFGKDEWGSGHAILIKKYYNCLKNGEKFDIDFYEAKNAVELILKMYESHGNEIKV